MSRSAMREVPIAQAVALAPCTPQISLARWDWRGRTVTIMGLGRHGGGAAAARFLAQRGARVTISDVADADALAGSLAEVGDVPLAALHLGGHQPADFQCDALVVNPAVRPDHPGLQIARSAGARLVSETELFLAHCPAQVVGVSGSNGKSTTCGMLQAILQAGGRRTWLGGNIGNSLLGDLERMRQDDLVVLEMSSFQLAHLSVDAAWPRWSIITNCTPNHLDWHGSFPAYAQAKCRLLDDSRSTAGIVLGGNDGTTTAWRALAGRRAVDPWPLNRVPQLVVPGEHNRRNAASAAAMAECHGVDATAICQTLASFAGLPHRLQYVGQVAGRSFYNDSKSTTPQAAIAALAALEQPCWLLAGGVSKGADFADLACTIAARARGVALFGAARPELAAAIRAQSSSLPMIVQEHLADALDACWAESHPREAILLSPACASHDQFADYRARGAAFCALAAQRGARLG